MCGIAGIIHFEGLQDASGKTVQSMLDVLRHRGPDGEGLYCDRQLAFGHRRLAILDLSDNGKQPFISRDGRFAITYN